MSKFYLSCDEANHTCDKTQYKEATLMDKIKLNFHLIFCAACRKYTKRNGKMTKLFKKKEVTLSKSDKKSLKSAFEKELQNH